MVMPLVAAAPLEADAATDVARTVQWIVRRMAGSAKLSIPPSTMMMMTVGSAAVLAVPWAP
jgi:hypothetical protein